MNLRRIFAMTLVVLMLYVLFRTFSFHSSYSAESAGWMDGSRLTAPTSVSRHLKTVRQHLLLVWGVLSGQPRWKDSDTDGDEHAQEDVYHAASSEDEDTGSWHLPFKPNAVRPPVPELVSTVAAHFRPCRRRSQTLSRSANSPPKTTSPPKTSGLGCMSATGLVDGVKHTVDLLPGGIAELRERLARRFNTTTEKLAELASSDELRQALFGADKAEAPCTLTHDEPGGPTEVTQSCKERVPYPDQKALERQFGSPFWADKCTLAQQLVSSTYRQVRILREYVCQFPLKEKKDLQDPDVRDEVQQWEMANGFIISVAGDTVDQPRHTAHLLLAMLAGRAILFDGVKGVGALWDLESYPEVRDWALKSQKPSLLPVLTVGGDGKGRDALACSDSWQEQFVSFPGVNLDWIVPELVFNMMHHERIVEWFGEEVSAVDPLSRFLWTPDSLPKVTRFVRDFRTDYFFGHNVIALQMNLDGGEERTSYLDERKATKYEMAVWDCILNKVATRYAKRRVRFLLDTNSVEAARRAQVSFGGRFLTPHYTGLSAPEKIHARVQLLASADELLLAHPDEVGLAARATFGGPTMIMRERSKGGTCGWVFSTAPCPKGGQTIEKELKSVSCFSKQHYRDYMPAEWFELDQNGWGC